MVKRFQVSLTVIDDETANFIDSLKVQKRLKTDIIKFLTKYAQDPEQVDLWLNEDNLVEDEYEDERILKLKSSLEIFKTFVDIVKQENEDNLEGFTDYLTNEEFHRFRTNFEKSEQGLIETDSNGSVETVANKVEIETSNNEVKELTDQVEALKMMVSELAKNQDKMLTQVKTELTDSLTQGVPESKQIEEEKVESFEDDSINEGEDTNKGEIVEVGDNAEIDKELKDVVDSSADALDILSGLGL